jgi:P27 family predicted phage terminase small subunit
MGRPRKPTELHVLNGTFRDDRHGGTVQAPPGIPEPPGGLSEGALAEWERIVPVLTALGLITLADRSTLAAYCCVYARWHQAEQELAKNGPVYKTSEGNMAQSPWLWVANKALDQLRTYAGLFGLSPSSRASLKTTPPDDASDPMAEFLRGS